MPGLERTILERNRLWFLNTHIFKGRMVYVTNIFKRNSWLAIKGQPSRLMKWLEVAKSHFIMPKRRWRGAHYGYPFLIRAKWGHPRSRVALSKPFFFLCFCLALFSFSPSPLFFVCRPLLPRAKMVACQFHHRKQAFLCFKLFSLLFKHSVVLMVEIKIMKIFPSLLQFRVEQWLFVQSSISISLFSDSILSSLSNMEISSILVCLGWILYNWSITNFLRFASSKTNWVASTYEYRPNQSGRIYKK